MADENCMGLSVNDNEWVLYKDRKEWEDVEPVPQNDGPYPVVAISYPDRFSDVYDYFRAVLKRREKSNRVLELTKDALELNPANYTVWQYRRMVLQHLNKDLREELQYSKSMILANPKNYQVWHHRRVIVEWLQDAGQELKLTEMILGDDAKNYHAWQYRQWVIKNFNLFDNELEFVNQLLEVDVRNNSAWNQRYFIIKHTAQFNLEALEKEVNFTIKKIRLVTFNESSWNYLKGLMTHCAVGSAIHEKVCKFCEELYHLGNRSPFLLAYIIDLCEELNQCSNNCSFFSLTFALKLCHMLSNEHDKIRCHYWSYIAKNLSYKMKNSGMSMNSNGD